MVNDLTAIMILMDASGSMEIIRDGVIEGVNGFVASQRGLPGHALFSLAQFDSSNYNKLDYKDIYDFRDIKEVPKLTRNEYTPRGGTPLLDAAARAINNFGAKLATIPENRRPEKVVFVIVTDGEENSSKNTTREKLFAMIKHQQDKYNWQVLYLGANQDSFAESRTLGIKHNSTANYDYTSKGVMQAMAATSNSLASYRSGIANTVDLLSRDEQESVEK